MAATHYKNCFVLFGYCAFVGNAVNSESAAADNGHFVFGKAARNLLGSLYSVFGRLSCSNHTDCKSVFVKAGNITLCKKRKRIVLNIQQSFRIKRTVRCDNINMVLLAIFKHLFPGTDINLFKPLKSCGVKAEKAL